MPYLILGFVLLGILLLFARLLVSADPARIAPLIRWFALGIGLAGIVALLAVLIASDRLGPALVIAGGGGVTFLRLRNAWRRHRGARSRVSEVETDTLTMRLDLDSGAMSGAVRRGPDAGKRLEDLGLAELVALWRQCIAADEAGARLLESYLDRLHPGWRQGTNERAPPSDTMTREQAFAILDLAPGAGPDRIREAHRRLMMKLHPDHGGSTFLAAQINRAKELLLGE